MLTFCISSYLFSIAKLKGNNLNPIIKVGVGDSVGGLGVFRTQRSIRKSRGWDGGIPPKIFVLPICQTKGRKHGGAELCQAHAQLG